MSHAKVGPSSSKKWLACTPSIQFESEFPDSGSGEAAREGTLAHSLAETIISKQLGLIKQRAYEAEIANIKSNPLYDGAMQEHCEQYATFVIEQYFGMQVETPDAIIMLEQKLDLTEYIPEGFGTVDVTFIGNRLLRIIDLKYGRGVFVDSDQNTQMMIYALGAYHSYGHLYGIDEIQMTIYQPRIDNISDFTMLVKDLLAWGEKTLKPKAKMAFNGEGEMVAGEHCRFCKARSVCRVNAAFQLKAVEKVFQEPATLSPDEVSDLLGKFEDFKLWAESVKDYALDRALNGGVEWPNYKLVHGKASRKYVSEDEVKARLKEKGFNSTDYLETSLLPVTRLEKKIGAGDFNTYLSDLIHKPLGAVSLVPVTDKRPAIDKNTEAAKAFE